MRPDGFAAARDEHVRKAKSADARRWRASWGSCASYSERLDAQPPGRDQQDVLEQLLELGQELGRAQSRRRGLS